MENNHPYQNDRDAVFAENQVLKRENTKLTNELRLGTKKYVWGLIRKPLLYSFIMCVSLVGFFGVAYKLEMGASHTAKIHLPAELPTKDKVQPFNLKNVSLKFSWSRNIEVKNLKKICNKNACFKYGESCRVEISSHKIIAVGKFKDSILFRYLIVNPSKQIAYDFQCPSNTLFFMKIDDVKKYNEDYKERQKFLDRIKKAKQEKLAKEKKEKEFIKRTLSTP